MSGTALKGREKEEKRNTKPKQTLWELFQQKPPITLKVRKQNIKDTVSNPSDYLGNSHPAGVNRAHFWGKTRDKEAETFYLNTLQANQNS